MYRILVLRARRAHVAGHRGRAPTSGWRTPGSAVPTGPAATVRCWACRDDPHEVARAQRGVSRQDGGCRARAQGNVSSLSRRHAGPPDSRDRRRRRGACGSGSAARPGLPWRWSRWWRRRRRSACGRSRCCSSRRSSRCTSWAAWRRWRSSCGSRCAKSIRRRRRPRPPCDCGRGPPPDWRSSSARSRSAAGSAPTMPRSRARISRPATGSGCRPWISRTRITWCASWA